jgi:hypothetical protein
MGPKTGNGRFGFVLGLRGKESFGWQEGKMKPKGKGWNREEGSVGAVVGCLWEQVVEMEKWRGSLVADLREEDGGTSGGFFYFLREGLRLRKRNEFRVFYF